MQNKRTLIIGSIVAAVLILAVIAGQSGLFTGRFMLFDRSRIRRTLTESPKMALPRYLFPTEERCKELKKWYDQGVLTQNLGGDISEARYCSRTYSFLWSGIPARNRCRSFRSWLDAGVLTKNLQGGVFNPEFQACKKYYPYDTDRTLTPDRCKQIFEWQRQGVLTQNLGGGDIQEAVDCRKHYSPDPTVTRSVDSPVGFITENLQDVFKFDVTAPALTDIRVSGITLICADTGAANAELDDNVMEVWVDGNKLLDTPENSQSCRWPRRKLSVWVPISAGNQKTFLVKYDTSADKNEWQAGESLSFNIFQNGFEWWSALTGTSTNINGYPINGHALEYQ